MQSAANLHVAGFMWQADLYGVAKFVTDCLGVNYDTDRRGGQASDAALGGWKRCNVSLSLALLVASSQNSVLSWHRFKPAPCSSSRPAYTQARCWS